MMCAHLTFEGRRTKPSLVRTGPLGLVAIHQHEFLHSLPRIHFAGIEISDGIDGDGVDPVEIAGHAAVVADGGGKFAVLAVWNPGLIVGPAGSHHGFSAAT